MEYGLKTTRLGIWIRSLLLRREQTPFLEGYVNGLSRGIKDKKVYCFRLLLKVELRGLINR